MKYKYNSAVILLLAGLGAVSYGIYRTDADDAPVAQRSARRAPSDRSIVVDQSSLTTAEELVRLPLTAAERSFADDALRLADQEMDLAFAQAVRITASQPRAASPEIKELDARLDQAQRALAADQAQVKELTAAIARPNAVGVQSLTDRLNLAQPILGFEYSGEVCQALADVRIVFPENVFPHFERAPYWRLGLREFSLDAKCECQIVEALR